MTGDMMNLRSLLEKTPDADLLREMIGFAAERLTKLLRGDFGSLAEVTLYSFFVSHHVSSMTDAVKK